MDQFKLGDLIQPFTKRCGDAKVSVSGVDVNKQFIETRANLVETDVSKYYVVPPRGFACNLMHIGRDERLPIAYNGTNADIVVTSAYFVFKIRADKTGVVLDEYLYMMLSRKESDRLTWFFTDSSVRGNLKAERFLDIQIPVPTLAEQKKIVAAWQGLRKMKEENAQLAEPLMALCQSFLQECKKKYGSVAIGECVERSDARNVAGKCGVESVRGISIEKIVIATKADMTNVPLGTYKMFSPEEFCYVTVTSRNGERISVAMNDSEAEYIVSSTYEVFRVSTKSRLLPGFLNLWLMRPEFDRYARFNSWGSARETFDWNDMCRVKIPLPPLDVQQSVVDIYRAANEAKKIAAEADRLSREICPALIQHVINEVA